MTDEPVPVEQIDRDLHRQLLTLANDNLRRRGLGEPIVDQLQLLARHRLSTHPDTRRIAEVIETHAGTHCAGCQAPLPDAEWIAEMIVRALGDTP